MIEYVYVEVGNDGFPINYDIQKAIDGCMYIDREPKKCTFNNLLLGKYDEDLKWNLFVGSIDFMSHLFKRLNKYPEPIDYPECIINDGLLNREIKKDKLFNFLKNYKNESIFVKPHTTKLFDGILVTEKQDLNYFRNVDDCDIWTSDKLDIESEWRIYVHRDTMVYSCNYSGDFTISPNYKYIQKLIDSCKKVQLAVSYTIDIAILKNKLNTVIEFNDFWGIGSYGLNPDRYISMLKNRYFNIIDY